MQNYQLFAMIYNMHRLLHSAVTECELFWDANFWPTLYMYCIYLNLMQTFGPLCTCTVFILI